MSYENLYIHGAWNSKGFHVSPPSDKGQEVDEGVITTLDGLRDYSELFRIERRGVRFYYSYMRYNLTGSSLSLRPGCNLGFTYVFEKEREAVVLDDMLGLMNKLKGELETLLNGNRIIITSDEDEKITTAKNHIKEYTNNAMAKKVIKALSTQGQTCIAFDDATNPKIFDALENVRAVIISPNIQSHAARFALEKQKLLTELEEKSLQNDRLKEENKRLNEIIAKTPLPPKNPTQQFSQVLSALKSISEDLSEIKKLHTITPVKNSTNYTIKDIIKKLLPFLNTLLLITILIVLVANSCKNKKHEPPTTGNDAKEQSGNRSNTQTETETPRIADTKSEHYEPSKWRADDAFSFENRQNNEH